MKRLVTVNPITRKPTNLPLAPWVTPILSGQYQNAAEIEELEPLDVFDPSEEDTLP